MLTLRCTAKLLKQLPQKSDPAPPDSTTQLGDWYLNSLNLGHARLVLAVSEKTLLPVVLPLKEAKTLPERLRTAIVDRLTQMGVTSDRIAAEAKQMEDFALARTASRSVLEVLNDFARAIEAHAAWRPNADTQQLMQFLDRTPLKPLKYSNPARETRLLFGIEQGQPTAPHEGVQPTTVFRIRVSLRFIQPAIWRRIECPDGTLNDLHYWIQGAMGWSNCHLHEFQVNGKRYSDPLMYDDDGFDEVAPEDSTTMRLGTLSKQHPAGLPFTYLYDFGDDWEHEVQIEGEHKPEAGVLYPRCVDGARACPPEDCGGVPGYERLCRVLAHPKSREYAEMRVWAGDFSPGRFSIDTATRAKQHGVHQFGSEDDFI